ncbi:PilZ domain-containing protein [Thalassiella azotivora]
MTTVQFPDEGEQVELALAAGDDVRSYTTWVDKADGYWMSVFTPHDVLVGDLPAVGTTMMLRWHSPRGRYEVDAEFLGADVDGGRQWELELGDEITLTQNRQYVRGGGGELVRMRMRTVDDLVATAPGPVPAPRVPDEPADRADGPAPDASDDVAPQEPVRTGPDPTVPVDGVVVDLSERGARCRFREVGLLTGDPVSITLQLDGETVTLDGDVLRVIPDAPGGRTDVVAVYEPDEDVAARIRRHVLQAQLRERQRARR